MFCAQLQVRLLETLDYAEKSGPMAKPQSQQRHSQQVNLLLSTVIAFAPGTSTAVHLCGLPFYYVWDVGDNGAPILNVFKRK